jgi:hypothetical protein
MESNSVCFDAVTLYITKLYLHCVAAGASVGKTRLRIALLHTPNCLCTLITSSIVILVGLHRHSAAVQAPCAVRSLHCTNCPIQHEWLLMGCHRRRFTCAPLSRAVQCHLLFTSIGFISTKLSMDRVQSAPCRGDVAGSKKLSMLSLQL